MPPSSSGSKNHDKQHRYTRAFERIDAARRAGFHIEAIMLCESIITDRLVSHLAARHRDGAAATSDRVRRYFDECARHLNQPSLRVRHIPVAQLVNALNEHFDDHGDGRFGELPERLRDWLRDRNDAAHAFVKTHPYTKTFPESLPSFEARLSTCSADGLALSRALDAWSRRKATKAL